MLNPWAVVSLLSWSGGNRWGWGIAGWKMFENVWFQAVLAQCLGHLEITWDEYLEWLHHWKLQVGSMLPFGLGVASQRGRNIWWSKQAQICALKMLLFGTVELLERPEHESLKWTKQQLSRAEIYLSRNMYAQRPSPTRLHPPTGALPGNSMAFYGFLMLFDAFCFRMIECVFCYDCMKLGCLSVKNLRPGGARRFIWLMGFDIVRTDCRDPRRTWAHDHLLPRPLQNVPWAWGGSREKSVLESELPLPCGSKSKPELATASFREKRETSKFQFEDPRSIPAVMKSKFR